MPWWLERATGWSWRFLVVGVLVYAVLVLASRLRVVVIPIFAALLVAAVLSPVVDWLAGHRIPRFVATWAVLIGLAAPVGVGMYYLGVSVWDEVAASDNTFDDVRTSVRDWLRTGPLGLSPEQVDEAEERVRSAVVSGATSGSFDRLTLGFEIVGGLFLAIVLTFFFLKDGPSMWGWIIDRVSTERRHVVDHAGRSAVRVLAAYMRGIAVTGVVDAVVIGIGLALIGVPLVLPLAVVTFFAAFLPVVGATLAGALAALVALSANGPGDALLVVGLTFVVQQVEGDVVMPVVMGRQVALHPAVTLVALAAGGALAGLVGAIVAVPSAAALRTIVSVVRHDVVAETLSRPPP